VDQGEEETWDTVGATERSISLPPITEVTVPEEAQEAAVANESQVSAEGRRLEPSPTTGTEQPEGAHVEEEAPTEAGIVDISSVLAAPTMTVVRSSL
jgi:hypothetical protein